MKSFACGDVVPANPATRTRIEDESLAALVSSTGPDPQQVDGRGELIAAVRPTPTVVA